MIKLIVSDVDGTLLGKGKCCVDAEVIETIKKLKEKNIVFAVASGRHLSELKEIFYNINDIYYIGSDGGCIDFCGDIIYHNSIEKYITDKYADKDDYVFQCSKYTYYNGKNLELISKLKEKYKSGLKLNCNISNIIKIIKYGPGYSETPECTYEIYKDSKWREWIKNGTSKGKAIEFLQKKLDIKIKETLVIGDNFNDISMMRYAGEKICMKNSPQQLRLMSSKVCENINDELLKIGGYYE